MKDDDIHEAESAARLFNFLSLTCGEQGDSYFLKQKYEQAQALFYLQTVVDEKNEYAWYGLAKTEAVKGNKSAAIEHLQKAVGLGFTNYKIMENEKAFDSIRNEKSILQLWMK